MLLSRTVGTGTTLRPSACMVGTATLFPTQPYTTWDWIEITSTGSGLSASRSNATMPCSGCSGTPAPTRGRTGSSRGRARPVVAVGEGARSEDRLAHPHDGGSLLDRDL